MDRRLKSYEQTPLEEGDSKTMGTIKATDP